MTATTRKISSPRPPDDDPCLAAPTLWVRIADPLGSIERAFGIPPTAAARLTCSAIECGTSQQQRQQREDDALSEDFFRGLPHVSHSHKAQLCGVAPRSARARTRATPVEERA